MMMGMMMGNDDGNDDGDSPLLGNDDDFTLLVLFTS